MLERGFLMTPYCSGALSTPMGEREIDGIGTALLDCLAACRIDFRVSW